MEATGYHHPLYAASLAENGTPMHLPRSDAWIIRRPIPGLPDEDAMGPYPLLVCRDWSELPSDLSAIGEDLVSVSAVADPFGAYREETLRRSFPDVLRPYKEHYVVNLRQPLRASVSSHHRRNTAKGLEAVTVEQLDDPQAFLLEWVSLYSVLVDRHGITGVAAFSDVSFASQLAVPGIVAFRAVRDGETVGMLLWYVSGGVAYYHLGAYSPIGYELRASFALFWSALEYFAEAGVSWASLGAAAGAFGSGRDGLARFKEGWATETRTAHFCGRILDAARYEEIVRNRHIGESAFFPAYRATSVASRSAAVPTAA